MAARHVRFPQGRVVGMSGLGDPMANRLVLLCHPTAGAAGFDPDPLLTSTWGLHLVSFDRPGYGSSDPYPGDSQPSAAGWADDVAEYFTHAESAASSVEHTDFGSIGVIGWREGGLFALSLAARHPDLVDRLVLVGCPALSTLRDAVDRAPESWFDPARLVPRFSEHDTAAYERRIERMLADARLQGTAGVDGDLACFQQEPPAIASVRADTLVVTGRRDDDVTPADGRSFTEHIRLSQTFVSERGGRDLIASAWQRILEHVAPAHGHVREIIARTM